MKESLQQYIKEVEAQDLTIEYECVNALQKTPWQVNVFVLETVRACWDSGQEWIGLPPRDALPIPPYPFSREPKYLNEEELQEFKVFKAKRNAVYTANAKNMSKRIQVERTLQLAEEYAKTENFWFVWQCDFRGRKYPVESFLSPQNADYSKALLEFSRSVAINNSEEAQWLAIHGANVFGVDKVSLEDREMWAYMNANKAIDVLNDPFSNKWWQEADKPWQALAWCKEWAEYTIARANGEPYETRLPCASDGSCNGLQHLSAMLRDLEGGKAVNLTPSDEPQDIYADVAKRATELLEEDGSEMAMHLLNIGICRKLTKRSVMIVPYSGTRHACRDYIMEALEDKCTGNNPWGDDFFEASMVLSGFVWQAIGDVIVSAFSAMQYIKDVAKLYVDNGIPFTWTTPTNLIVRQFYTDRKSKRIKTHIAGSLVALRYYEDMGDKIDSRKTLSGASPNFVHSLDAAALTMTVHECLKDGILDYAMVHDSYGTHSPNMPRLNQRLREAFVVMYQEHDVLLNLYEDAVVSLPEGTLVPAPPSKGDLDLTQVLQSDYFFA
jgi:DNA-directed RNA polymerase